MQADEEKVITGWARINGGLSILQISLSNFDLYAWFFSQKRAHAILYKTLWKELLQRITMKLYPINTTMLQNGPLSKQSFSY